MDTSIRSGRVQALVSWAAAVLLLSLILWLSGVLPLGALDDILSVGAAASVLVVFVLISGEVRKREPWASVTLVLGITGMTLVLAGDALQHVFFHSLPAADPNKGAIWAVAFALRDWLGNGLFCASLILLGGLLVGQGRCPGDCQRGTRLPRPGLRVCAWPAPAHEFFAARRLGGRARLHLVAPGKPCRRGSTGSHG
jgi:hypothetical protein